MRQQRQMVYENGAMYELIPINHRGASWVAKNFMFECTPTEAQKEFAWEAMTPAERQEMVSRSYIQL